jgi:hypothetical protein
MTRFNPLDRDSASNLRSGGFRGGDESLLHFRMGKGESRQLLLRCGSKISRACAHIDHGDLVSTTALKKVEDAEFSRFGDAPRGQHLSSHTIFEMRLALQYEDSGSSLGHYFRKSRAGHPASDRDEVIA